MLSFMYSLGLFAANDMLFEQFEIGLATYSTFLIHRYCARNT